MAEPFRHRLRVRWSECDLQGVVLYPQYLAYLDHTVTELWREAIGPYTEMIPNHGVDMVVAEAGMRYRGSARFDDELEISATITRLGDTSITTEFRIERAGDGEARVILARQGDSWVAERVESVARPPGRAARDARSHAAGPCAATPEPPAGPRGWRPA